MSYSYTDLLALFGIGGAHPGGLTLTRAVLDELPINEETALLEVGCGTGQTTAYLAHHFPCRLYAIDQHPVMIEKTRKRLLGKQDSISLLEGSAEDLPFVDNKFDYILSESVTAFTKVQESLKEYSRVLKQSGTLTLIEMTKLQSLSDHESRELLDFYGIHDIFSEEDWLLHLERSGFKNVTTFSIQLEELVPDEDDFTEFDISPGVDPSLFDKLDRHEELTSKYKNKLGFRVFFCKKA
ncbi:class I SAM-dependent methyltransferase [Bacillus pinisoli]|uniref:class I SAM-dependent methyltransferase n=1 Tax=Bacillus pinisoli TaxID=2901866 RepID=UPI001FF2FD59|nr:class I SAM-dependent methyltransferase [Bacillus pinisoli]